jgi:hypothetical protein
MKEHVAITPANPSTSLIQESVDALQPKIPN